MRAKPVNKQPQSIDFIIEQIAASIQALPREQDLSEILLDAQVASDRGYYLPDEDERLRLVYSDYLRVRSILLESIYELRAELKTPLLWQQNLKVFTIGFTAACMLVRAATFIVELAEKSPVIWMKLDEAEPRFNLERKSLSRLYKSLSSPALMWRFHEATRFFECNSEEIFQLSDENASFSELICQLRSEEPFLQAKKGNYLKRRFKYRLYDFIRRNQSGYRKAMFHLFRLSGSAIAEMKQPFSGKNEQKQVNDEVIKEIRQNLRPGDIIITRHMDALSNLFLPGFWPHAALYIGTPQQRAEIGVDLASHHDIIESKKDGVKLRSLEETLAVDYFLILRSRLQSEHLSQVIAAAATHVGKRYDFLFDFTKADRLACTELIYRSYHAVDLIHFELRNHTRRMCLSAEDLINQAIRSENFSPVALFGLSGEDISYHPESLDLLKGSYDAKF